MNSRERTLMALDHQAPDRPPVSASYTPEIVQLLRSVYGRPEEDLGYVMGNDLIKTTVGIELSYHRSTDPVYTCPFGVTFRNVKNFAGSYTEIVDGALRDDPEGEKLAAYRIPDPDDPAWYAPVRAAVQKYGAEKFIIGSCQCSIFETAWYLHGMEDTLCDMIANEDYAGALFDKVMQFPLRAGLNLIDCGVDMVWLGDDVATQRGMMFSLDLWRRLLKPRYAELFAAFRAKRPDIQLAYHSCGNCEQILDDMIEIGPECLKPHSAAVDGPRRDQAPLRQKAHALRRDRCAKAPALRHARGSPPGRTGRQKRSGRGRRLHSLPSAPHPIRHQPGEHPGVLRGGPPMNSRERVIAAIHHIQPRPLPH